MTQDADPGSNPQEPAGPPAPPPTPLDHPLFLPILLFAGCIWFGYDGFINTDPDMMEHRTFNQIGFALLVAGTVWYGRLGIREFLEDREKERLGGDSPEG